MEELYIRIADVYTSVILGSGVDLASEVTAGRWWQGVAARTGLLW